MVYIVFFISSSLRFCFSTIPNNDSTTTICFCIMPNNNGVLTTFTSRTLPDNNIVFSFDIIIVANKNCV